MALVTLKRGDTFSFLASFRDLNDEPLVGILSQLKSQVRDSDDNLLSNMIITEEGNPGDYAFTAPSTSSWPIETVYFDVQFTSDAGVVDSTPTYSIKVEKDITYD